MKLLMTSAATALALGAGVAAAQDAPEREAVLGTYADIAAASFEDSLIAARRLGEAVGALVENPSAAALDAAKDAWIAARVPYQQTEVYRFGNPIVDAWEGKVNAWPLDEGLIDYVETGGSTDENPYADVNVIANPTFTLSGEEVDASVIDAALLEDTLHEADAIEANVATGYHAIEFLLWGQDLNGTDAGAGARPWTDYAAGDQCTGGACERRGQYLTTATDLLISDIEWMASQWTQGGAARQALMDDPEAGIVAIFTGMGSLSYGEQAGERMKLGLMLNDPEEEHDCFSDNTHNSHYYDGLGIRNVYEGRYARIDGSLVEGPSPADLVAAEDPAVDEALRLALGNSMAELGRIKAVAEAGFAYDQMLARGSQGGQLIEAAVEALVEQTRAIERAVATLDLQAIAFEGSDSLDDPTAVFQ